MSITDELRGFADDWDWLDPKAGEFPRKLRAIADRIDAEHERQLDVQYRDMSDAEWVRLPKDADNVPWNVGDCDEDGNEVTELRLTSSGWHVLTDDEWPYRPERHRHYHAPTVEDVLTEFGIDWEHESDCEDRAALLKEYAAKLRLAEMEDA